MSLDIKKQAQLTLIDKYLPTYTFSEYHETLVDNPSIEDVYAAGEDVDMAESSFIPLLLKLRGLPTDSLRAQDFIKAMRFTDLEKSPPKEQLYGFMKTEKIIPITSLQFFDENPLSANLKVVFSFQYHQFSEQQIKVSTETRVLCVGLTKKLRYSFYWVVIRFFSGVIRKEILKLIKQKAEQ